MRLMPSFSDWSVGASEKYFYLQFVSFWLFVVGRFPTKYEIAKAKVLYIRATDDDRLRKCLLNIYVLSLVKSVEGPIDMRFLRLADIEACFCLKVLLRSLGQNNTLVFNQRVLMSGVLNSLLIERLSNEN